MKTRPILFNGPMVRALLAGTKTQTRRPIRLPMTRGVLFRDVWRPFDPEILDDHPGMLASACPYGVPGDRLWVRETWSPDHRDVYPCYEFVYAADATVRDADRREHIHACTEAKRARGERHHECLACASFRWRPSIHMPRRASRLTYEVTEVRVQRFSEISEEDAKAEGVQPVPFCKAGRATGLEHVEAFEDLIASLYGLDAWDKWCWAVTFRRVP